MIARRCSWIAAGAASWLAAAAALASNDAPPPRQPDQLGGYATTHIIVRLAPGLAVDSDGGGGPRIDGGAIDELMRVWGVTRVAPMLSAPPKDAGHPAAERLGRTLRVHVAAGTDTPAMAAQFAAAAGVELATVDDVGGISGFLPNDIGFGAQWNMHNTGQSGGTPDADIDAPDAWGVFRGSAAVTLAILDTGIQGTHPDLLGRVIPGRNVYDGNDNTDDPHGHGTHVTGIAAANGDNAVGVAGVNWNCRLLPVRCTSSSGSTTASITSDAMMWAVDNGADILSMSLQFYSDSALLLSDAVTYAVDHGVLPVAASGNGRGQLVAFPARYAPCVAVGGTTRFDQRWSSANYGPELDVVAPALEVYSLWNGNGYLTFSGTSMATPHVSGLAALLLGFNPSLTPGQLTDILTATVDDLGPGGFDIEYGYGRINAYAALAAASPYPMGDLNCDGAVNFFDIDAFLVALFDLAAYPTTYVGCDISRGDFDLDAAVNFFDIDPFVAALFAP